MVPLRHASGGCIIEAVRSQPAIAVRERKDSSMHGEYKTPGGKLVMVDFELADAHLRNVVVSGDFFLYPDDALFAIRDSLEGLSAALDEAAIADEVRSAIPPGTEVLGTSPAGIAIAVHRALVADAEGAEA
jgi:lipoate-protein ligase A